LTPSRIQETWEKMRPENRFEQMTPDEQMTFILSDEGADFRYKFSIDVEGKKYPISVPGKAVRVFNDENVRFIMDNPRENNPGILKAAFLLFAGYVDAATTVAQNCGGGFGPNLLSFSIFEGNSSSILSYRQLRIKV
jgi:hypothetical protein